MELLGLSSYDFNACKARNLGVCFVSPAVEYVSPGLLGISSVIAKTVEISN